MTEQKTRIWLRSYDHDVIDSSAKKAVETVASVGAIVVGSIPLSTEKNVYAVARSPHKYRDSRERFEVRTHKRLIGVIGPTPSAMDSLIHLGLPTGVKIETKL